MDPRYATQTISSSGMVMIMAAEMLDLEMKWNVFVKRTETTEKKFKPKLRTFFSVQESSVIARAKRAPLPKLAKAPSEEAEAAAEKYVKKIFKSAAWQAQLMAVGLPFITLAFKEAGVAVFVDVGVVAAFNVTNPIAKKILQERVFKFAQSVNKTTEDRLRSQLVHAFSRGESIPQISKRIANVFDIAKGSRTDTIARTEIVGASNQGSYQGYLDSEIVETNIWVDSRDARVRTSPHNHRLDGQERALGKRFSNGLLHPHDPGGAAGNVINCRCTTAAGKLKKAARKGIG